MKNNNEIIDQSDQQRRLPCGCPMYDEYSQCIQQSHVGTAPRVTGNKKIDLERSIREATARGYCHYINEHKVLDPDLLNAITYEVMKVLEVK